MLYHYSLRLLRFQFHGAVDLPAAVPKGYKIREGFSVLPSGKRDTLSLKTDREGFFKVDGSGMLNQLSFTK
jgi:hypothetical protein